LHPGMLRMRLGNLFAENRTSHNSFRRRCHYALENVVVDGTRRRLIAPPEAGHIANLHIRRAVLCESLLQLRAELTRSIQMAAHVRANTYIRFGRRRKMKVRIETGDAMNLIKR